MAYQPRVIRSRASFEATRWTADVMAAIAQEFADNIKTRIMGGSTVSDAAARPLSAGYVKQKRQMGASDFRDWTRSGWLMRLLKVLTVSNGRAVIGFVSQPAVWVGRFKRPATPVLVAILQRMERMFGVSPRNKAFIAQRIAAAARVKINSQAA